MSAAGNRVCVVAEPALTALDSLRTALGDLAAPVTGLEPNQGLLAVPAGQQLVVTVDTLVCGVHFTLERGAEAIGHKSLAVNLSDLAAMGAEPRWVSLVLSVPADSPADWLSAFAGGFRRLAERETVAVTALQVQPGPLRVTVQAFGVVPAGAALLRAGARPGDRIMVTGTLGDAALALRLGLAPDGGGNARAAALARRLDRPEPRTAFGQALRGLAHAAIDVSDGLIPDLGHILERSGCGACLRFERLPLSAEARALGDAALVRECALTGGDDYELCFTVAPEHEAEVHRRADGLGLAVSAVGEIEARRGLRAREPGGAVHSLSSGGWDHFRW